MVWSVQPSNQLISVEDDQNISIYLDMTEFGPQVSQPE